MKGGRLAGIHVAVLGGGLAGISAALECADQGARVTVLERRRGLGGLTRSFRHNGLWMDNGQHVHLACCQAYLRFVDRIGSAPGLEPARPLDVPVVAPGPVPAAAPVVGRLRRRDLPVPLHLAPGLVRYPHLGAGARLRLGRALAALARLDLDDPRLDDVAFGEWLAAHGQTAEAVSGLWDLITVPTVNLHAGEASLATAAMVMKTGLLSARDAADIGWARVPLAALHGGRAAAALARSGVAVRLGTRARAVSWRDRAWEVNLDGGRIEADAVVSALPHEDALGVLPVGVAPTQRHWPDLGSSAIVDVHLVFDRPVTTWPVFAGHRSPVQWVFDRSGPSGLDSSPSRPAPGAARPQYLAVSLSAADDLLGVRPEELVRTTSAELARLLPAVTGARLLDSAVTKERRATFRAAPGANRIRPDARTGAPSLVLAGAWTATGWPATMEGAVRSGRAAARALTETLAHGRHGIPPVSDRPGDPFEIPQEVA